MRKNLFKIGIYFMLIACGYMIHKTGIINRAYQKYLNSIESEEYREHVELSKNLNPKSIELIIPDSNLNTLNDQRRLALELGPYYQNVPRFTGYVKGKLVHGNDTMKIKLRLKGLFPDHYADSLKCSYKIKIKGSKTFNGMKKFAIQHPKTREYLNEWYLHRLFDYVDITYLRYKFINVTINGRNSGIYALEENMHKNLVENNQMKEGPIFRFSIEDGTGPMFCRPLKPYGRGRLKSDSSLLLQYQYAEMLMYEFRDGHKKTSEIFDVEKMSKFLALIDLTGHHHASHPHNLKFYFNPVTSLIEPVGYDNSSFLPLENQGLLGNVKNVKAPIRNRGEVQWKNDPLSEQLFNDSMFFNSYMHYLTEYSNKEWLTSFFLKYNESAQEQLQTIWRSYPEYDFLGKEILFHNQEIIRNNLELCIEPVIKDDLIVNENGQAELKFRNPNSLPLELLSVKVDSKVYTLENLFLESSYNRERQQFTSISIEEVFEDTVNVQVEYKIFGVDKVHIFDYECTTENRIRTDVSKVPALNNFGDLSSLKALVIEDGNIDFTKGEYLFDSDIIIPAGYLVKLNPGVRINLVNGAKIISQSPFIAEGLENDSIHFYSTDKTGEGIFILKTAEQSKFEYCRFSGLSNLIDAPWKLSGAVNFYKAEVLMNHCLLSSNLRGDDMLNIMNSNFEINNCVFMKVLADALDGDFAIGKIVNCEFEMIGNDAMDFSGSNITIESCRISDVEDKALSAGEKSVVDIKSLVIRNSVIAITAKDKSMIKGENITISGADIGISAFQKKSQFGPGRIELTGCKFSQVKIENMIEKGSLLLLNGIEIKGEHADVEDLLYGNVYGKMTIK